MNDQNNRYCLPNEAGHTSSTRQVAKRVADLLNACERINAWVCHGPIVNGVDIFRRDLITKLRADGHLVKVKQKTDRWQVTLRTTRLDAAH